MHDFWSRGGTAWIPNSVLSFFYNKFAKYEELRAGNNWPTDCWWLDTSLWVKDLSRKTDIQPILDFICKFINFVLWCLLRFRVLHFKNVSNKRKIKRLDLPFVYSSWILARKKEKEKKRQCFCLKSRRMWELALPIQRAEGELVKSRSEEPQWKTVNSCHLKTLNPSEIF